MKTTKEDWLKCITTRKTMEETSQEIGKTICFICLFIHLFLVVVMVVLGFELRAYHSIHISSPIFFSF
jgi:hypothetical protein